MSMCWLSLSPVVTLTLPAPRDCVHAPQQLSKGQQAVGLGGGPVTLALMHLEGQGAL